MQNVLDTGKRVMSAAIAAATIAFTVGAAALVSPVIAEAASAGDLIKGTSLSTVYYQSYDGTRYAFPNEKTYFSWYVDFDDVDVISDTELAAITLGGNIVVRAGTHFIKITSDAKTYAVARDGMIHWIETEAVAVDLAGSDWASNIIDVPDVFFADYTVGTSLMSATAFEGALYEMGGDTYLSWGGEMRMVDAAGMTANNLWDSFVLDGANIDDSALTMGSDITAFVLSLSDTAQTEEGESAVTGDITVSESSSSPVGVTLPGRTNAVELFSFDVEAGSEDATVDSITLSMIGAGATSNIQSVYLYEGDTRLTEARSVNTSTRQVVFSSLGLMIDANSEMTLTARVEVAVAQTASDTIGFEITSATDVEASGDVDGSFPISGDEFTMSGSDAGWLEVDKSGSISDPTLGEQDAVIGTFKVATNSEAASVQQMTIKVDNASDHSDFWLWDGSVALVAGTNTTGDLVLFDLSGDEFAIEEGSSNIFSVSADVGGQDADTVKVFVDNRVDIVAEGGDFGFGMCVDTGSTSCTASAAVGSYDGTSCTSSAGSCSFSTLQGGEVTITANGPSSGDIMVNGKDEVLMNFSITAAQDVTFKDFDIIVYGDDDGDNDPFDSVDAGADTDTDGLINADTEANLTDIKIINADTGSFLTGPFELDNVTDDDEQTIDFTDDFSVDAGETLNLAITVDVDNGAGTGTEFGATIDISGLSIEDTNGDALTLATDVVPTGDIVGYAQEALAASLTVTLASTPGDVTTVDGTDNVHSQSFTLVAGDGGDVLVNSIQLSMYADEDGSGTFTAGDVSGADVNDFVESCTLKDSAGAVIDGPASAIATGLTIDFNDVDWTIAAGANETVKVYCNFGNPSDGSDSNFFAIDIADLSEDIVAEDEDGNDVDPTTDAPNGSTSPTNVVTVAAVGSVAVTADSSTASADYLLTNTADNNVASYRFTATNEAFDINILSFSEEQAEDDTGTTNSSAYNNNIGEVTITYPKADGTEGTKSVSMTGNEAKFSALDMYVAVGTPAIVDVFVDVPTTDRDAGGQAQSNEKVRMGWFVDVTTFDNFEAVGVGSGTTFNDGDSDGAGTDYTAVGDDAYATDGISTFVVRETKPTVTLSSSSPSGAKVPGDQEVYRFNVAASSNEDVVLDQIIFKVSATDNTGTPTTWDNCDNAASGTVLDAADFDFYNLSEQGTAAALDVDGDWMPLVSTGLTCDVAGSDDLAFVRMNLTTMEIVPKGQTYTYSLWMDVSGASAANDDTIQIELASDPIVGTLVALGTARTVSGAHTINTTTLTGSAALDTNGTGLSAVAIGDILAAAGTERMLVTAYTGGASTATVVRGYLGTTPTVYSGGEAITRAAGAFLWQDDGTTAVSSSTQEYYGAHLVDNLAVTGNSLVF